MRLDDTTTTIRALDYWLGVPACALLSGVRRITGAAPSKRAPGKILFLKFIEQGATVLAQDAIARATRAVGRDHVFFCVFESNRAILDVIGTVPAANIITIRDQALTTFVVDFLQAAMTIRRHRIDTVIDMEFFSRASAIFAFMTGAATRVGLHRFTGELPYRGNLMTHRIQYLPQLHISTQYSVLVEAAFSPTRLRAGRADVESAARSDSIDVAPGRAGLRADHRRDRRDAHAARLAHRTGLRPQSQRQRSVAAAEMGDVSLCANWRRASSRRIQAGSSC